MTGNFTERESLSPSNRQQALVEAINLTDEILEVLENGEFGRVSELEAARKVYIEQAFTDSLVEIDRIKAEHLKNLNQQVVDHVILGARYPDQLDFFRYFVLHQEKVFSEEQAFVWSLLDHLYLA